MLLFQSAGESHTWAGFRELLQTVALKKITKQFGFNQCVVVVVVVCPSVTTHKHQPSPF